MSTAAERLLAERRNMRRARGYMFCANPVKAQGRLNIMQWECGFPGVGVYGDGYFRLHLFFKQTYPFTPPVAQFVFPVYHPNVYDNGTVCLDLLTTKWKPSLGVERILYALQQLLVAPNTRSPANKAAGDEYERNRERFAKKVHTNIRRFHTGVFWMDR